MNGDVRGALARTIAALRRLLAGDRAGEPGDIGRLLAAPYGFDPQTGVPKSLASLSYLRPHERATAERLRAWHAQLVAATPGTDEVSSERSAFDQMRYELGYTAVHRICALRMSEERGVVIECVRRGQASDGFAMYLRLAGETTLGTHGEAYRFFLDRLYDELARSLPSVFDRRAPASLVAPSPTALDEMTRLIASDELADAWQHEETLGWIFEDWNDPVERKEMRKHSAPRNARELAVRNQFFTPRWVVEFLTDNTLGRLWFERTRGKTALRYECRYLALRAGEHVDVAETGNAATVVAPPAQAENGDPRDIRVFDPACGSGHFLLYAFNLLETIYLEAWARKRDRSPGRTPVWEEFPDEAVFRREVPRLIVENNLYGVDIDPRCIQEAALALWLRAQSSWKALGVRAADRPVVRTGHVVSAQALPESPELRAKLLGTLKPAVLGRLVEKLFLRVGEMGVLLRLDDILRETVGEVKRAYVEWKQSERKAASLLFKEFAERPKQTSLDEFHELATLGDDDFWHEAEKRIVEALDALVEAATDGEHHGSRLFADGVRHGFEYLDVARLTFDVVLMNPPFGEPTEGTKEALDAAYPNAGHDVYAMFYERALEMLRDGGRVGAITSRSWIALPTLDEFRTNVVGGSGAVDVVADLGYGVLNAKVETAAAVLRKGAGRDEPGVWVRLVKTRRKSETLLDAVRAVGGHRMRFDVPLSRFDALPAHVFGYWMSDSLLAACTAPVRVESVADAVVGTQTSADPRFLRLAWEVPASSIGLDLDWARFAKGGEYRPFYDDVHLVIRWTDGGREIIASGRGRPQNIEYFGRPGVTWPMRNQKFGPRALPAGLAFGHKGPASFSEPTLGPCVLGVLAAQPTALLLAIRLGIADDDPKAISPAFEVGLIGDLPWPTLNEVQSSRLATLAREAATLTREAQLEADDAGETCVSFAVPGVLLANVRARASFANCVDSRVFAREDAIARLAAIQAEIDAVVAGAYGFSESDRLVVDEELEPPIVSYTGETSVDAAIFKTAYLTKEAIDGALLPGGVDAEADVRVEHRRGKQRSLRDETRLCRLFEIRPERLAAIRRGLGLLRKEDLARAAADLLSYAVGVAFGRWDLRLATHPEWIPTFADPFDPLPPCPLGQLVGADGLPATRDHIASDAWLAARRDPTRLPTATDLNSAAAGIRSESYPVAVAWDGILVDDTLSDDAPRRPDGEILSCIDAALEHLLGDARSDIEHDVLAALEVSSLTEWYRTPGHFFDDHVSRYSKSRRIAPIYWPFSTESGGLTFWAYGPRYSAETLASVINRLRTNVENVRAQSERSQTAALDDSRGRREAGRLAREATERSALLERLRKLTERGYAPHVDDGTVVSLAPLAFAFRNAKFRGKLEEVADGLEKGEYDWAHVAMSMWPERVRKKCETDASLAIAHGLAPSVAPAAKPKRARKKSGGGADDKQLALGGGARK